ncbi:MULTISPECIES: aa3-type cytochrome oxidase subunit CtaJ [unclassified Gordonia (in: high G+C Gram-positive bacteria)]|uniref:aa3-type cytochrome oxidase subunit CtaJ n=1 Tax=unclassified Gordonia (in: high G+C Gram-positive bacteria) TaxID=2657482 RepID=UPI001FFF7D97|nr:MULTISPECIES: hypothetical protein [unclassified Gordonia (in: high G+C Gram-positive bacteria)]UQE76527.1 hypothetical protein MYK68_08160 [Gordonia sp. PP30]
MDSVVAPIGLTVIILVLIAIAGCVISMLFSHGVKRPKVPEYTLDQEWTRGPALFSATEIEPMALPRHFEPADTEGGYASAKW